MNQPTSGWNDREVIDVSENKPLWQRLIPLYILVVLGIFGMLAYGWMQVSINQSMTPDVLAKQAQLVESQGKFWTDLQPTLVSMPSVLVSVAYATIGIAAGIAVLIIVLAIGIGIVRIQAQRFLEQGIGVIRETGSNGQKKFIIGSPGAVMLADHQHRVSVSTHALPGAASGAGYLPTGKLNPPARQTDYQPGPDYQPVKRPAASVPASQPVTAAAHPVNSQPVAQQVNERPTLEELRERLRRQNEQEAAREKAQTVSRPVGTVATGNPDLGQHHKHKGHGK